MADSPRSFFDDTYHTLLDRLKNPFGLAFVVAWLINNWRLLYTISHLPEEYHYYRKLWLIHFYIKLSGWWGLLLWPIFEALFAVFIYYLCSLVANTISLWYEKRWQPWINNQVHNSTVVNVGIYDKLDEMYINLKTRNDLLNKEKGNLESALDHYVEKASKDAASIAAAEHLVSEMNKKMEEFKNLQKLGLKNISEDVFKRLPIMKFHGKKMHFSREGGITVWEDAKFHFPKSITLDFPNRLLYYTLEDRTIFKWVMVNNETIIGTAIRPPESPAFDMFIMKVDMSHEPDTGF